MSFVHHYYLLPMRNRIIPIFLLSILTLWGCNKGEPSSETAAMEGVNKDFELEEYDIAAIHQKYKDGSLTAVKVVEQYIARIKEMDQSGLGLNSVIAINPDALAIAQTLDEEFKAGTIRSPLHGIPVLLKDNIDTHDKMPTTAGSRALKDSYPLQDSYVAKKLREAGAIILGKANLSEWANFRGEMSSSGWSAVGGQAHNPYVLDRNPCGSSSGSGVAVSANFTMLAIGTETNGSIVCPSTANGIVGIKPTVGLVSRSGVVPISFTQDTPGPMARTVKDAALCLSALTGVDEKDSKTLASKGNAALDYSIFLKKDGLKGKRLGYYTASRGTHNKVDELMDRAIEELKAQGAEVIEIDQIAQENVGGASFQVMLYEYKDGLNNYFASLGDKAPIKSVDDLIAFNKKDDLELSFYNQAYLEQANEKGDLNSKEYLELLEKMQTAMRQNGIDRVMDENNLDAIIAPTGSPAWKTDHVNGDHYQLSSSSPAAIAGYPNITVPMGFISELPVGISFFGKAWTEGALIEVAYAYEQATKHRRAPKFLETLPQ